MFTSFRYPTPKQGLIWLKRRQQVRPSVIAKELDVSRPFVSKTQQRAEARIKKLLEHAAAINRVEVKHLNPRHGIVVGYCPATQTDTYITYSPTLGIHTWFSHTGDCASCAQNMECEKTLRQLAAEWEINLPDNQPPTEIALHLFNTILKRLNLKEVKS
ncbi:MAG: hypothetical protein ACFE9D_07710 [Promethearchaeota archaeon]